LEFKFEVCGSHAETMTRCAELLDESVSVDFVDINSGCPIDIITNRGAGSALLENPRRLQDIIRNMNQVLSVPLTLKVRIGKDEKAPSIHKFFPMLESWGASAVTIHGRSRLQRYSKQANWDYIEQCAKLTNLPVLGNGDIFSFLEYEEHMKNSKLASVMLARGAIIKPWIFTEIKERRHWDISSSERLEFIRNFINFGLEHWGSDQQGVNNTRRFFLEWQSFLWRYIPVGLLEVIPQRVSQKPPKMFGRDDLETLFASDQISDWIKISEMFLGPAPANFVFVPKHRASDNG